MFESKEMKEMNFEKRLWCCGVFVCMYVCKYVCMCQNILFSKKKGMYKLKIRMYACVYVYVTL